MTSCTTDSEALVKARPEAPALELMTYSAARSTWIRILEQRYFVDVA